MFYQNFMSYTLHLGFENLVNYFEGDFDFYYLKALHKSLKIGIKIKY